MRMIGLVVTGVIAACVGEEPTAKPPTGPDASSPAVDAGMVVDAGDPKEVGPDPIKNCTVEGFGAAEVYPALANSADVAPDGGFGGAYGGVLSADEKERFLTLLNHRIARATRVGTTWTYKNDIASVAGGCGADGSTWHALARDDKTLWFVAGSMTLNSGVSTEICEAQRTDTKLSFDVPAKRYGVADYNVGVISVSSQPGHLYATLAPKMLTTPPDLYDLALSATDSTVQPLFQNPGPRAGGVVSQDGLAILYASVDPNDVKADTAIVKFSSRLSKNDKFPEGTSVASAGQPINGIPTWASADLCTLMYYGPGSENRVARTFYAKRTRMP
jgi:hypothetical protein